ncbi:MAG: M28 family peptidase, partial [Bacteroidota bacterium]|nr:M28 family peptidase [Bacteroidota bacterium]
PVRTGPQLSRLCANIASRFGLDSKSVWVPLGASMDHIPFAAHGYEAVTLSTAGWDIPFRSIHTKHDTPDALDISSLEHCYAVCRELADAVGLYGTAD